MDEDIIIEETQSDATDGQGDDQPEATRPRRGRPRKADKPEPQECNARATAKLAGVCAAVGIRPDDSLRALDPEAFDTARAQMAEVATHIGLHLRQRIHEILRGVVHDLRNPQ